jgi:hypothetical protein
MIEPGPDPGREDQGATYFPTRQWGPPGRD